MSAGKPYTPRHDRIAEWCGVSVRAVRAWASGESAAPAQALVTICEHDERVDIGALARHWTARWRVKRDRAQVRAVLV